MTPEPEDPYGIAKYAVELDLKAARRIFQLPFVVFRPHNVYGERQNLADRYRNVVGIFMNQVMNGAPMSVFGSGLQTRAFSHIDDVAPIIAGAPMVQAAYGEVFNVGAVAPTTVLDLASAVAARVWRRPEHPTPARRVRRPSCTRLRATSRKCVRMFWPRSDSGARRWYQADGGVGAGGDWRDGTRSPEGAGGRSQRALFLVPPVVTTPRISIVVGGNFPTQSDADGTAARRRRSAGTSDHLHALVASRGHAWLRVVRRFNGMARVRERSHRSGAWASRSPAIRLLRIPSDSSVSIERRLPQMANCNVLYL